MQMNTQYLSVHLIHEFVVDRPPSVQSLDDRIIAQKVVYLANQFGIHCGDYQFTWYKKGPYSPSLTKVLYSETEQLNHFDYSQFKIRDDIQRTLTPLKDAIKYNSLNMSEADWVELLASVHFLYDEYSYLGVQTVMDRLVLEKPKYTKEQGYQALDILAKIGIIHYH